MAKEKGLLCNSQVALAIREGRQTNDRRLIKPQPEYHDGYRYWWKGDWDTRGGPCAGVCTHGSPGNGEATWTLKEIAEHAPHQVGDLLYVREGFTLTSCQQDGPPTTQTVLYMADKDKMVFDVGQNWCPANYNIKWKPNIHMPKRLARTWVKVNRVWVEQLLDISDKDCIAEGMGPNENCEGDNFGDFINFWYSMYGSKPDNPWLWCTEFERIKK